MAAKMPKAGNINVFCAHDEVVPIETIKPHPRNPNRHPEKQVQILSKIIREQGWRAPIAISNRSGFIVRGHGRLAAAQLLGAKKVPVDFQDYETEDAELADLVADNRIAELAEMDKEGVMSILQSIDAELIDVDVTGYTQDAINEIIKPVEPLDIGDPVDIAKHVTVNCPSCGHEFEI